MTLSAADLAAFDRDGCVLLRGFFSAEEVRDLTRWVNDLQCWCAPTPAEQLSGTHYTFHHEQLDDGSRALCRIENYTPFHGGLDAVARERALGFDHSHNTNFNWDKYHNWLDYAAAAEDVPS